jgi:hypothetical protein
MVEWYMNWKGLGRNRIIISEFAWRYWENFLIIMDRCPAEIQTEQLSNSSLERFTAVLTLLFYKYPNRTEHLPYSSLHRPTGFEPGLLNPLRLTTEYIFSTTCCRSPNVTSSLTRGWVCRLPSLLVLASAFILGSESHGTYDHILLSQIRDSPNLKGQVPLFIWPKNKVVQLYAQALTSVFDASCDS